MSGRIVDLAGAGARVHEECAEILVAAFARLSPVYCPDLETARSEVADALDGENLGRVLLDSDGRVLGWVGAMPIYDGHVWEVHPLAVSPQAQGRGHGRRLIEDLERLAAGAGVSTLWLGSDDEVGATSLGGRDLYDDPLEALRKIENLDRHPYEFYLRCGFTIVGVLPDANGRGKPDIFLAKRVERRDER